MSNERAQRVLDRLSGHFEKMDIAVLPHTAAEWATIGLPDPTTNRTFGWVEPIDVETQTMFAFSPEVIAAQTEDLTEEEFEAYIDVIQFTSDLAIALYHVEDPYERSRMIDNRLFDTAKGSMRLLNSVQMKVLDQAGAR